MDRFGGKARIRKYGVEPLFAGRDEEKHGTVVESEKKETVRQKLVLRLGLHDDTEAKKAMRAVESLKGVDSVAIDKKRKEMTVLGVVDPMAIVSELRKFCRAHLKSVSPAEEKGNQKETVGQKLVLGLGLHDNTEAKKAMRAVESLKGVDSVAIDKKRKEMTVVGVVDPMAIVSELRKFCRADVKSVSPAEEKGNQKEKREESKKGKAEKEGSKKTDEVNTRFEDEAEADESEEALSAPSISRCLDIVDALADMVSSYNLQHGQLADLLDILRQLGISLRKAQAVLHFAKQQQAKDKELLAQLEAAVLDSEDLLDELDCQVLQQRMVGDKAGNLQPSALSFDANPDRFISQVMKFVKRLATISDEMREIIMLLEDDLYERQDEKLSVEGNTIFSLIKPQVFGNEEKESLIQVLLRSADGSGSTKSNFSLLSIVGSRGVGKTALAKLVCHDQRVQKHFELKIWVCASESFDAKRLIEEIIIESSTAEKQSILTDLDSLQLILKEKVMSRRFVLVLDDVRIKDSSEWQKLYLPLNHGLQGSMILVTARSLRIANQLDTSYPIFLAGLTDDVISQASDLMKSEVRPELEDIGKRVAAKLEGSPLAAKLIGGLLKSKMDPGHWRKINNHIRPQSRWECDIQPFLQLCHQYLPARLRRCFSFCSIFPKDYIFRQDDLVFCWMALGFVAPQGNMRMEDVGTTYFQDLTSRSFFEQSQLNHQYFVIHGVMHDLAESESFCCLHNMQFLFIKGCSFEGFPEGFTNLINLRYIDIESNRFSVITEIGKLTFLQELPCFEVQAKLDNKEYRAVTKITKIMLP